MKGRNIYHICNLSPKVVFRREEDFLFAISRLAVCAFTYNIEVLAFAIMSTHFHIVTLGDDDDTVKFVSHYKRSLALWHNKHYRAKLSLNVSKNLVIGISHTISVINYVLKNPIHHGVSITPFTYPYTSAQVYFLPFLRREEYFIGEFIAPVLKKPSELRSRDFEKIFGKQKASEKFKVLRDILIIPESFISIGIVERIYSSPRNFLYQMNRPLTEDIKEFDDAFTNDSRHLKKAILTNQISDIEAAKIFDKTISPRTYTEIRKEEFNQLWLEVKKKGISEAQFNRLL